eukprot:scaffold104882_cov51-Prasinocladus_malaysianus.AAC.1
MDSVPKPQQVYNSFIGEHMQIVPSCIDTADIITELSNLDCSKDSAADIGPNFHDFATSQLGSGRGLIDQQSEKLQNQHNDMSGHLWDQGFPGSPHNLTSSPRDGRSLSYGSYQPGLAGSSISSSEDVQFGNASDLPNPQPYMLGASLPVEGVESWNEVEDQLFQMMSDDLVPPGRKSSDSSNMRPSTPQCSTSYTFSIVDCCPAMVQPGKAQRVVLVVDGMEDFDPQCQTFSVNVGGVLCEPVWIQNGAISFTTPRLSEGSVQVALVNSQEEPWQQLSGLHTLRVASDRMTRILGKNPLPGTDKQQQMSLIRSLLKNRTAADICALVA